MAKKADPMDFTWNRYFSVALPWLPAERGRAGPPVAAIRSECIDAQRNRALKHGEEDIDGPAVALS